MEKLVIATRGSRLALWQANHVKDSLEAVHPGLAVELNIIKTKEGHANKELARMASQVEALCEKWED